MQYVTYSNYREYDGCYKVQREGVYKVQGSENFPVLKIWIIHGFIIYRYWVILIFDESGIQEKFSKFNIFVKYPVLFFYPLLAQLDN